MGYETHYKLRIQTPEPNREDEILEQIIETESEGYPDLRWALGNDGYSGCRSKWYEHFRDMIEISLKYPDIIFHLLGEGEESGDIWEKTFVNGKCHAREAQIVMEEFDPSKLR